MRPEGTCFLIAFRAWWLLLSLAPRVATIIQRNVCCSMNLQKALFREQSLLHRIKTSDYSPQDLGQSAKLLAPCNIDHSKLLEYVTDVVKYATKGTLKTLELKIVGNNQPDIAAFDFTSIKKAEHAARIIERNGSKLLVGLVGDSLLEVSSRRKRKGEHCREVKPNSVKICGFIAIFIFHKFDPLSLSKILL